MCELHQPHLLAPWVTDMMDTHARAPQSFPSAEQFPTTLSHSLTDNVCTSDKTAVITEESVFGVTVRLYQTTLRAWRNLRSIPSQAPLLTHNRGSDYWEVMTQGNAAYTYMLLPPFPSQLLPQRWTATHLNDDKYSTISLECRRDSSHRQSSVLWPDSFLLMPCMSQVAHRP